MNAIPAQQPRARRARRLFLLLALLFATPSLLAWWLLRHPEWLPASKPRGTLLQPPPELADLQLRRADGGGSARLHGKWTLLQLDDGRCTAPCGELLRRARYVRQATGRQAHRVQQVLLAGTLPGEQPRQRFAAQPGLLLHEGSERATRALISVISSAIVGPAAGAQGGRLYLLDPAGRVILVYAADTLPGAMLKDLKRLLRYNRGLE